MYATDVLNLKYSKQRSKSSVHTYQGGRQEISTQHADGSEGLFKSNGEFQSTNNSMDTEIKEYMNNNLDKNKQYNTNRNMNKKLIRLTENDLHRIVKESVNRILSEAINELDPRTYASYAQKRAAQGQDDKAWQGQVAARNAFNKQYGTDNQYYGQDGSYNNKTYGMYGNDYTVTDAEQNVSRHPYHNGEERAKGYAQRYNPHNDTYDYEDWDKPVYDDHTQSTHRSRVRINDPRNKIASQMAQGNGKYIKGQGWQ